MQGEHWGGMPWLRVSPVRLVLVIGQMKIGNEIKIEEKEGIWRACALTHSGRGD